MSRKAPGLLFGMVWVLGSCSTHRIEMSRVENQVTRDGLITVGANWYQDEGNKYDIQLHISNESDKAFIIMLSDILCFKGNLRGTLKHTFFNTGERTIDFQAGEQKAFNMVCRLGSDATGDPRVVVKRIYENPTADGVQKGSVMGTDVEWKMRKADSQTTGSDTPPATAPQK